LDTKRLDLDAAKSRLKRAKSLQSRESVSFAVFVLVISNIWHRQLL